MMRPLRLTWCVGIGLIIAAGFLGTHRIAIAVAVIGVVFISVEFNGIRELFRRWRRQGMD